MSRRVEELLCRSIYSLGASGERLGWVNLDSEAQNLIHWYTVRVVKDPFKLGHKVSPNGFVSWLGTSKTTHRVG